MVHFCMGPVVYLISIIRLKVTKQRKSAFIRSYTTSLIRSSLIIFSVCKTLNILFYFDYLGGVAVAYAAAVLEVSGFCFKKAFKINHLF